MANWEYQGNWKYESQSVATLKIRFAEFDSKTTLRVENKTPQVICGDIVVACCKNVTKKNSPIWTKDRRRA